MSGTKATEHVDVSTTAEEQESELLAADEHATTNCLHVVRSAYLVV